MKSFLSDFPSPFDDAVVKLTSEIWIAEDWKKINELFWKIHNSQDCKDCLRAIIKRLNNKNSCIVSVAISLLDIFSCDYGRSKEFKLQIASEEFGLEFYNLLNKNRNKPEIYGKLTYVLKKWAEGAYKSDRQLRMIPMLYGALKHEGHDFSYIFEMRYPWSFYDKYPMVASTYTSAIKEGKYVLEEIQKGFPGAWITMPFTIKRCKKLLADLTNGVSYDWYKEFKGTADMLKIEEELKNIIKSLENEIIKKKLRPEDD